MFLLGLISCKENCTEYSLGNLIYSNPYSGSETIVFVKTDGDSLVFNGEGRYRSSARTEYTGDCYISEIDYCMFMESEGRYRIFLQLSPTSFHDPARMFLQVSDYTYNERWHYSSMVELLLPFSEENLIEDQLYFDSLMVIDKYYYNVYTSKTGLDRSPTRPPTSYIPPIHSDTIHPSILYYTIDYGLIKVDFEDSTSWELKEIIQ